MKKVSPPELSLEVSELENDKTSLTALGEKLHQTFKISLEGSWNQMQASTLHEHLEELCKPVEKSGQSATEICGIEGETHWKIHDGLLVDDASAVGTDILIAKSAFDFAAAQAAKLDGESGVVRSHKLQFALMKILTNWGQKEKVVNQILQRKFGSQLDVDVGYIDLTSVTTYEDRERFQAFKAPELLFMMESWSLLPKHLVKTTSSSRRTDLYFQHKVEGLKYVVRRQQGLNHPYYGPTTAVSWPTNMDNSYQEYMDYSFNNDGYTSRHLFIHEKTHFFWGRMWDDQMKKDWEAAGSWKEKGNDFWMTDQTIPFASDYGASNNPDEDIAECMAAYVLHPMLLQARAPVKEEFIRKHIMRDTRYLERPIFTFDIDNREPYRRYPPSVNHIDIRVEGDPNDDKTVEMKMLVDVGHGWHSPIHAEVTVSGPNGGSKTLNLYPDPVEEENGGLITMRATEVFSKYCENGFWSASQIKMVDKIGSERWIKVDQYSWRLYLNNGMGTTWAPRYLPQTLKLEKSLEKDDESGLNYPVVKATIRYQQTGAPLDKTSPVWMRLASKPNSNRGGMNEAEWDGSGTSSYSYPQYQKGECVQDTNSWDGSCTVSWKLSPYSAAGHYYVSMIQLKDIASNTRNQFFTQQKPGWTCCGRVGNTPNDEFPVLTDLQQCAKGTKISPDNICVEQDVSPPILDHESIRIQVEPMQASEPDGASVVKVYFKAKDDKSGIGTVGYRLMDPQGFSHQGYMSHENEYGPIFHGDSSAWNEYTLKVELAKGSPGGKWQLESLDIHDKAGNRKHHQFIELLQFVTSR
eukprot:768320-Hanusia_phi.AAC.18